MTNIQTGLENILGSAHDLIGGPHRNRQAGLKLGIIIATLVLSVAFSARGNIQLAGYIGIASIALIAMIIFTRRPYMGILSLIFATMLVPSPFGSLGAIINTAIILVAFLLVVWLLDMVIAKRQIQLVASKTTVPAIVFIVIVLIAFLNGQLVYANFAQIAPFRMQIAGVGLMIFSMGAFLLSANQIKERIWLERMLWLFVILSGLYIVFGRLAPFSISERVRPLFQYGSDASIFWIWFVAITSSQALFNMELKPRWRFLLLALLISALYVSFRQAYDWKSGWLPPLIGLATIFWIGFKRYRLTLLLMVFFIAIFSFSSIGNFVTGEEDYSILTRFPAWNVVLEISKLNPILGIGIANYIWYTPTYSILDFSGLMFSSHNNYIDIIAQTGIIGLICFLWFFFEISRLAWKLKDKVPHGFARAYVIGAIGGIVGTLVSGMLGDWIIPFVYNVGLPGFRSSVFAWLFMGGLVVLEQIYIRNLSPENSG